MPTNARRAKRLPARASSYQSKIVGRVFFLSPSQGYTGDLQNSKKACLGEIEGRRGRFLNFSTCPCGLVGGFYRGVTVPNRSKDPAAAQKGKKAAGQG